MTQKRFLLFLICALFISSVIGSSVGIPLGFAQLSLYRVMILVVTVALGYTLTKSIGQRKSNLKPDSTLIFLGFWLLYAFVSILWAEDKTAWFKAMFFIVTGFISVVAIYHVIKTGRAFNALLNVVVLCAAVITFLGWYELFSQSDFFNTTLEKNNIIYCVYHKIPVLWFGNVNNLAFYLTLSFFFVYLKRQTTKRLCLRIGLDLTMALMIALLIQTFSRASLLGLLIGLLALLFHQVYQIIRRRKRLLPFVATLILMLILIPLPRMLLYKAPHPVALVEQLNILGLGINIDWKAATSDVSTLVGSDVFSGALQGLNEEEIRKLIASGELTSERIRVNLIVNGLDILKRTFFMGSGTGNLELWMSKADLPMDTYGILNIHNFWAEVLSTYGILVFLPVAFGFVIYGIRFLLYALRYRSMKNQTFAISMAAVMGAFFLSSISPSSILKVEFFWIYFGVVLTAGKLVPFLQAEEEQPLPKRVVFMSALDLWSMEEGKGAPSFYNTVKAYIDDGWQVSFVKPVGGNRKWYSLTGYKQLGFRNALLEYFFRFRIIGSFARYLSAKYCTAQFYRLAAGELEDTPGLIYAYEVEAVEAGRKLSVQYHLPLVTRFQGTIMFEYKNNLLNRYRLYPHIQALTQESDMVIMTNDGSFGEDVLRKFGNRTPTLHFWRNGVMRHDKVSSGAQLRKDLEIAPQTIVLLTVSRVVSWKRIDRAIQALSSVLTDHPDTVLVVVGGGSAIEENQALAKELGVDQRVFFVGAVPHKDLYAYYDMADIFLSLYDFGNVGNPIMEAMVMGKTILTINNGDTKSLMGDSEYGLMVDSTDQDLINQGLKKLLDNPAWARQYGQAAKAYAKNNLWTWEERMQAELQETSKLLKR